MNTRCTPEELCVALLARSSCAVRVSAVIADRWGIYGWGWNSMGSTGLGEHAEVSCLKRSNPHRQEGSTMWVCAERSRPSGARAIIAKPCPWCQGWLQARGIGRVMWRSGDGEWHELDGAALKGLSNGDV